MYKTKYLLNIALFAAIAMSSSMTLAAPGCKYSTLVANIIEAQKTGAKKPTKNTSVCVDVPLKTKSAKVVFNIDTQITTNGKPDGTPVGPRHMFLYGTAILARMHKLHLNKKHFSIIGVFHGSAITWVLSDEWWKKQTGKDGKQLYPNGNPNSEWLKKLFALKKKGLNLQIEACGVTMYGKHLTNADLYPDVLVNQGAIGRIIDLQKHGYSYYQEGYIDNDGM